MKCYNLPRYMFTYLWDFQYWSNVGDPMPYTIWGWCPSHPSKCWLTGGWFMKSGLPHDISPKWLDWFIVELCWVAKPPWTIVISCYILHSWSTYNSFYSSYIILFGLFLIVIDIVNLAIISYKRHWIPHVFLAKSPFSYVVSFGFPTGWGPVISWFINH